jgi:signal transduction histidine kinase
MAATTEERVTRLRTRLRHLLDHVVSIDILLQSVCAIMAAALVGTFGVRAIQSYESFHEARRTSAEVVITRDLFDAMKALRIERGMANTDLVLEPDPISAEQTVEIAALRAQSHTSIAAALARLRSDPFPERDALVAAAVQAEKNLETARKGLDQAVVLPAPLRDADLSVAWLKSASDLFDALNNLAERLPTMGAPTDSHIAQMMNIERLVWLTLDSGSMDRLALAQALADGNQLTAVQRQQIENRSGRIISPWHLVRDEQRLGKTPAVLARAIENAQQIYFTQMCHKRVAVITALTKGRLSPISEREWLAVSKKGLQSVVNVADVAVALAAGFAADDTVAAERRFIGSIAGVIIFLGFGIFTVLFVARRVALPIRRLALATHAVAHGNLDGSVPYQSRADEIGQLARALEVFRTNAIEKRRMEAALIASKEEAETSSRAKSNFLANMSHELRTPLNAIIGFAELMESETFGPIGSPRYQEYAATIRGSGTHLLGLINDVLDLSRLDAGRADLHEETIFVEHLVETVLTMIEQQAAKNGVKLVKDIARDLPRLNGDARRVRQVLINLLSNAIKFTASGGTVSIRVARNILGELSFEIGDTGVGIAAQDISKALTRFGQVDSRLARKFEGAGLGLPLAKQLIELHGGTLSLTSKVDVGTVVTVTFPLERLVRPELAKSA